MVSTLFFIGIAYLIRVKQSIQINKILYIILGNCISFFIWMISIPIQNGLIAQGYNEYAVTIVFLVVFVGLIGSLIGLLIGRLRNWKGPGTYQP